MSATTPDVEPAVLSRIREYRAAARIAVEADATEQTRQLALLALVDALRAEPDPLVVRWGEIAVWEEARAMLGMDDDEPWTPPPSFDATVRRLQHEGNVTCPTCTQRLPEEADLERWAAIRRVGAERRDARKGAVR